jgi:hypothetical protein
MDVKNAFGAGLKDAKVKGSDGIVHDIYGIVTAEGQTQREETEVRGDDQILGTFGSSLREELTLEANAINFDALAAVLGNTVTEVADVSAKISMGTPIELTGVFVEIQAYTNAKFKSGQSAEIKKTWHKVQINTATISQAGEQEWKLTLEGVALQTDQDIEGNAFSPAETKVATLEVYTTEPGSS